MQVISSNGYWELREGKKFMSDLNFSFIGTIVNLEFDLQNPDTFYYFKDDLVPVALYKGKDSKGENIILNELVKTVRNVSKAFATIKFSKGNGTGIPQTKVKALFCMQNK